MAELSTTPRGGWTRRIRHPGAGTGAGGTGTAGSGRGAAADGPGTRTLAGSPRMGPAYAACAVALGACFVWLALAFTSLGGPRLEGLPFGPFGSRILIMLACAIAGTISLAHPAGRSVGRLLLVTSTGELVGHTALIVGGALGCDGWVRTAVMLAGFAGDCLYVFLLYGLPFWLPDGTLPGRTPAARRRWRALMVGIALWTVAEVYLDTGTADSRYNMDNPLASQQPWTTITAALEPALRAPLVFMPLTLSALGFLVLAARAWRGGRGRRGWRGWTGAGGSGGRSRLPGAPLVLVLPFLLLTVVSYVDYFAPVEGNAGLVLLYGPLALLPLALVLAFARDRSAHLDRATRRVLAVLVTLALLLVGYFALAVALSDVLPGTRTPGALVLAVGSLVIGLLLRATGGWAVRTVDRSYYGDRARPYQVVRDLAGRLSRTVTPGEAPRLLCETVVETLRFPAARVLVRTSGGSRPTAALGTATDLARHRFPLVFEGVDVGELEVAARPSEPELDQQDHDVLRLLADQAAPAIASLGLYEELQASRERIVLAREEARRRLRHDLHDGLAPALSGLRLQVDTARAGLPAEEPAGRRLDGVSDGIAEAIVELRRITAGLTPSALDRDGLGPSLRQLANGLAGRPLRIAVELRPDPLPDLPAAVEVALYRIAAEALHNVVRHAGARHAWVRLCVDDGTARLEVRDDGAGMGAASVASGAGVGAGVGTGVGLRSMAERAEELGGRLEVCGGSDDGSEDGSGDGPGVLVRAEVPVRPLPG